MESHVIYESPEVEVLEIVTEGILCDSTESDNESLYEFDGIW